MRPPKTRRPVTDPRDILIRAEAALVLCRRYARNDFWAFCMHMDPAFFVRRGALRIVADAFMRVSAAYDSGTLRRLAVSLPPRAGKSYLTTLFIAWMLGRHPRESVMRNCCSSPLYQKLSYDTRDIVRSARYTEVFPEVVLRRDRQNVDGWGLSGAQISYFGGGVGGTVIGFGASMLAVTDDLYKSLEDALSETINEKTWSWKQGTHDSRLEKHCCSIDIGTRWSSRDVLGRMEEAGLYDEVIRIPALDENDESFCPDVHTTDYYRQIRSELDESIWSAEYMQEPYEARGLLFPPSELKRFKRADIAGRTPDGIIAAVDTADLGEDFFAAPFALVFGTELYVVDVLFTRDGIELTAPRLAQKAIDTGADIMRIESNNGGRAFALETMRLVKLADPRSRCTIEPRRTTQNKETRILMKSGWIKQHVHFLDSSEYTRGSEYGRFMDNLTGYKKEGGNKHDDAPDATTILAELYTSLAGNYSGRPVRRVAHQGGTRR